MSLPAVSAALSRTLGQQFIVENVAVPAAAPSTRAMRASPDGFTLVLGNMGTHGLGGALPEPRLPAGHRFRAHQHGRRPASGDNGEEGLTPNDLKEFATHARANVDKLNMAHAGVGSITHVTCLLLNALSTEANHGAVQRRRAGR